jgi:type II secretory pathway pseudopilin PulG
MENRSAPLQIHRNYSGFTITEVAVAMFLMGVIAVVALPKILNSQEDRQADALVRDSFTTIGEMYIARKTNPDYADEDIDTLSNIGGNTFARFLYSHINYLTATDPTAVAGTDYCTVPSDYFVLPMNVTIRSLCDDDTTVPKTLNVTVWVPKNNPMDTIVVNNGINGVEYVLTIPEGEDRYTTDYGFTGVVASCHLDVDPILRIVDSCP